MRVPNTDTELPAQTSERNPALSLLDTKKNGNSVFRPLMCRSIFAPCAYQRQPRMTMTVGSGTSSIRGRLAKWNHLPEKGGVPGGCAAEKENFNRKCQKVSDGRICYCLLSDSFVPAWITLIYVVVCRLSLSNQSINRGTKCTPSYGLPD